MMDRVDRLTARAEENKYQRELAVGWWGPKKKKKKKRETQKNQHGININPILNERVEG
jgi:hypothetical protein